MNHQKSTIERALELARSSSCRNLADIKSVLKSEGYANIISTFTGAGIKKQITGAIRTRTAATVEAVLRR